MQDSLNYKVNPKENIYFLIKVVIAILVVLMILSSLYTMSRVLDMSVLFSNPTLIVIGFYMTLIILFLLFRHAVFIGYIKGNGVQINKNQFPDIYETIENQSKQLGLKQTPKSYILQQGGLLNAFATRFIGINYVIIYSDILEEAYENNKESVDFIIGHELGHIKRNHLSKRLWTLPSLVIPFLDAAYSRACEYTCDSIGASLSPKGVRNGLVLLASGKKLYHRVQFNSLMNQGNHEGGFWYWFSEKISSHPHLVKRLYPFAENEYSVNNVFVKPKNVVKTEEENHDRFLPQ